MKNNALTLLQENSQSISEYILTYIDMLEHKHAQQLQTKDTLEYLRLVINEGKHIRGSLFLTMTQLLGGSSADTLAHTQIAASFECMQLALLVHDDIMDQDVLRRGKPSAYAFMQQKYTSETFSDPTRMSESLAICMGDVYFFAGFELFSQAAVQLVQTKQLFEFFSTEYVHVGLGQMQDVFNGHQRSNATKQQIKEVHLYKTALYTISLPLTCAAIATNTSKLVQDQLYEIGKKIGLLFQIRDDYLDLFSSSKQSGKTQYSDIKDGKETLYKLFTLEIASKRSDTHITETFGNQSASQSQLSSVIEYMKMHGVVDAVATEVSELLEQVTGLIEQLELNSATKRFLLDFARYIATRQK